MTLARAIRDGAEALSNSGGGHLNETPQSLYASGTFTDETLIAWRNIAVDLEGSDIGALVAIDSFGNAIDLRTARIEDLTDPIRLVFEKALIEHAVRLFLPSSIGGLLANQEASSKARSVYVAEDFAPFSTASCLFSAWGTAAPSATVADVVNIDPRRFVRDFTGTGSVPKSTGIYILKSDPQQHSNVFRIWSDAATIHLALCLVNEIWEENGARMVSLIGPRTRKIPLGTPNSADVGLFESLKNVSQWVYAKSEEVEIRHTLFTNELAREWPEDSCLYEQFSYRATKALDSAMTAYRAYLRNESKETLKSLSDLRKALSEEVSKVSAQTRELVGILWRDFAIAIAAVLSRVALIFADKKSSADSLPMEAVLVGTAVFLLVDLAITLKTNARFMQISAESRSVWRRKLYGYLTDDEVRVLADEPIQKSTDTYDQAKRVVSGIYVIVVFVLLSISFPTLWTALSNQAEGLWHLLIRQIFH